MENTTATLSFLHEYCMEVRDYECDMADGVNNAIYQNYLEHARHQMLKENGIDYASLARAKIGLVILRSEIDYLKSLVSGDQFVVNTSMCRISRLRFEFLQDIVRTNDGARIVKAKITGTCLSPKGRPALTPELEALLVKMCVPNK